MKQINLNIFAKLFSRPKIFQKLVTFGKIRKIFFKVSQEHNQSACNLPLYISTRAQSIMNLMTEVYYKAEVN